MRHTFGFDAVDRTGVGDLAGGEDLDLAMDRLAGFLEVALDDLLEA